MKHPKSNKAGEGIRVKGFGFGKFKFMGLGLGFQDFIVCVCIYIYINIYIYMHAYKCARTLLVRKMGILRHRYRSSLHRHIQHMLADVSDCSEFYTPTPKP